LIDRKQDSMADDQPVQIDQSDDTFFGPWLRRRRRSLDLTQDALAQQVGCAVDTLRKFEAGMRRPSHPMAERLAHCLAIPLAEQAAFLTAARSGHAPRNRSLSLKPAPSTTVLPMHARRIGYLPASMTSFIGREWEISTVSTRLRIPEVRLVTLTGTGGVGKTRLALQIARALADSFPDGVWFVNLAPISDPALVLPTIAQALGIREQAGTSIAETLRTGLSEKQVLVLLDNFEQVVMAAPELAALLTDLPMLKLLATSREALRLYGEHVVVVAPLAVPEPSAIQAAQQLTQYAAVQLFVERAHAVAEHFRVTDANAVAIAAICARLDGLPLAIELAAAQIALFSPQALLTRLDQRLPLPHPWPARHTRPPTNNPRYDCLELRSARTRGAATLCTPGRVCRWRYDCGS
jgi:transcriptional regulator with XRE-family HTH domain